MLEGERERVRRAIQLARLANHFGQYPVEFVGANIKSRVVRDLEQFNSRQVEAHCANTNTEMFPLRARAYQSWSGN